MTNLLGKTVEETGDKIITTKFKYNNNKQNMVLSYKKWQMTNHPPSPVDDLVILGVTFERHPRLMTRVASQKLEEDLT